MKNPWTPTPAATTAAHTILAAWDTPAPQPRQPDRPFHLQPQQAAAASWARTTLDSFHGALIADAVGTGKSFIALELIHQTASLGQPTLVTPPAPLTSQWKKLLEHTTGPVTICSHTRLHRLPSHPPFHFVVVDEAHAFRNPRTRRYSALARLCHHARVLLLTATPINNSILDLLALLRLFATDSHFARLGVPSLRTAFESATTTPPQHRLDPTPTLPPTAPAALHRILDAICLRRPRDLAANPDLFPTRATPTPVHYNLDEARPGLLHSLLHGIASLRLAPYQQPAGTAALVRLNLLKRLDSSLPAFSASLHTLATFLHAALSELHHGRSLSPANHRSLHQPHRHSLQLAFSPLLLPPSQPHHHSLSTSTTPPSPDDLQHDLHTCRQLLDLLRSTPHDPKANRLASLLTSLPNHRRTLIFTEYIETARALESSLRHLPGIARIDSHSASIAGSPTPPHLITRQFTPGHHPDSTPRHLRINTLICTDILSEGLNLQLADTAIAYDLPWNPTRLIQRFGRIDRRDSPHPTIHLFTFMPDHGLDQMLALLERLRTKLAAAHITTTNTLSHDLLRHLDLPLDQQTPPPTTTTRTPDSTPDRDQLIRAARTSIAAAPHPLPHLAGQTPNTHLAHTSRPPFLPQPTALVTLHHSTTPLLLLVHLSTPPRCLPTDHPDYSLLHPLLLHALHNTSPTTAHPLLTTTARTAAATAIRFLRAARLTRHPRTPHLPTTATRAIRRLLTSSSTPGGPTPTLAKLTDQTIQRLSQGLTAHQENAVRQWLASPPPRSAQDAEHAASTLASTLSTPQHQQPGHGLRRTRVISTILFT